MDLCGISVIEFRAGRPVLRAHNLTAHLAALTDEKALADTRGTSSRSGAPLALLAAFLASEGEPQQADP